MPDNDSSNILLIATVGSTPEPLVASIRKWQPERVLFLPSPDTSDKISCIRDLLKKQEYDLSAGQFDTVLVPDHQNFSDCVRMMRCELEKHVAQWRERGEGHKCVVDFTGGTKCMSAALALVARPWPAVQFSYVGGAQRDKDNVGIVVAGSEQVVSDINPWDTLGYQVVEEAISAFDLHAYGWGAEHLRKALRNVTDVGRKIELSTLATFMGAYDRWDRLDFKDSFGKFAECTKRLNDLAAAVPGISQDQFRQHVEKARNRLESLRQGSNDPTRALLEDLIANIARRREEDRHLDSVARLYRAIEVVAQLRLSELGIDTSKVSLEDIPEPMRDRFKARANDDGELKIALQDAYEVLYHKEDPLGKRFIDLGWNKPVSPLSERNDSIAGHGFSPVSPKVSDKLWEGALSLAGITEEEVFQFPKLGKPP